MKNTCYPSIILAPQSNAPLGLNCYIIGDNSDLKTMSPPTHVSRSTICVSTWLPLYHETWVGFGRSSKEGNSHTVSSTLKYFKIKVQIVQFYSFLAGEKEIQKKFKFVKTCSNFGIFSDKILILTKSKPTWESVLVRVKITREFDAFDVCKI